MGYCMDNHGCHFRMKKEYANDALKALKELFSKEGYRAGWVDTATVLKAETFEDALGECWFEIGSYRPDVYDYIYFSGEKYSGNEMEILASFAKYVEEGSYIEMEGEDGQIWRWVFRGFSVEEQEAKIVWE